MTYCLRSGFTPSHPSALETGRYYPFAGAFGLARADPETLCTILCILHPLAVIREIARRLSNAFPCFFLLANPNLILSLIISLSISANPLNIVKKNFPIGVEVSMF